MNIAVVAIEGVLSETDNLKNSPPTKHGKALFDALKTQYRVVLVSAQPDRELAHDWLRREHFSGFAMVLCYPDTSLFGTTDWKPMAVREMLSDGWDVALFIDSDQRAASSIREEGIPVLMMSYPAMSVRPGRLMDEPGPVRPWDEMVATMETKNLLEGG